MADRPLSIYPPPTHRRIRVHFDDAGELTEYTLYPTPELEARAWRCFVLAPTIEIYEALLRGDKVPVHQLRPEGVRRLWKRPA